MKFGVVIFPGSNCEQDCYYVIESVLGKPVEYIWHQETAVKGFDAIILPGGFSYGDYLRTGALAKFSPVMTAIADFARSSTASDDRSGSRPRASPIAGRYPSGPVGSLVSAQGPSMVVI